MRNANQVLDASDTTRRRPRVRTENLEPSKTVQSDRFRAEITHVLAKYRETGVMVGLSSADLTFRDVSEFTDFAEMARATKVAEHEFMRLPSKVREVFHGDVMEWLDAAKDGVTPEQHAKLVKLGVVDEVVDPAKPVVAADADVVPTAPADPPASP